MTKCFIDFLKKQDVKYHENFPISQISSMGVGGKANVVAFPNNIHNLIDEIDFLTEQKIKFKVLGGMTNILPCDEKIDGVLLLTKKIDSYSVAENILTAECGVKLSKVISEAAKFNLGGMENLFGIPGSIGGIVYMNAGAYGTSVSDFLISASIYLPKEKRILKFASSDMDFSYRYSKIKDTDLILLSADFSLNYIPCETVKNNIRSIIKKRKSAQPYGEKSLGSVFKRNKDIPISRLVDELGLKGFKIGGAKVSEKHAGFIVNTGGATAKDVKDLISFLKSKIKTVYGIDAEEEIEILN